MQKAKPEPDEGPPLDLLVAELEDFGLKAGFLKPVRKGPAPMGPQEFEGSFLAESNLFPQNSPARRFPAAPFHRAVLDLLGRFRRLILQVSRDYAKSTVFTVLRVLWLIAENRDVRVLIVSKTQKAAEDLIDPIKRQLEFNERLIRAYGPFKGERWTGTEFEVKRMAGYKEPTVRAVGRGGQVISGRYDLIILDDVQDFVAATSETEREKTYQWFLRDVMPMAQAGTIIVIQTPQHEDDLAARLAKTGAWTLINLPAEYEEGQEPPYAPPPEAHPKIRWLRRRSMWPTKWPVYWDPECPLATAEKDAAGKRLPPPWAEMHRLSEVACKACPVYTDPASIGYVNCLTGKRFEVTPVAYRLEYLCDVSALGGVIFAEPWFNWYSYWPMGPAEAVRRHSPFDTEWVPGKGWHFRGLPLEIGFGIDPAIADEEEKSPETKSEFALVVLGVHRPTRLQVLLWYWTGRPTWPEQLKVIFDQWETWQPKVIVTEDAAYQKALKQAVREILKGYTADYQFRVRGIKPDIDEFRRLVSLTPDIEAGHLYVLRHPPWQCDWDAKTPVCQQHLCEKKGHRRFVSQAVKYPRGTHTDLLNAYYYAKRGLLEGRQWFEGEGRPTGPPPQPHVVEPKFGSPRPGEWTGKDMVGR